MCDTRARARQEEELEDLRLKLKKEKETRSRAIDKGVMERELEAVKNQAGEARMTVEVTMHNSQCFLRGRLLFSPLELLLLEYC